MNKHRPKTGAIFMMFAFTASCVGLLLFLWLSFGGSIPLQPEGYRFNVEFPDAVELGSEAQVEISGVTVGHVVSVNLDRRTGLTRALIEINQPFSPRPANTRAILRAKTLLGETYVELSAGSPNSPKLPDGGTLPEAQVSPTVGLDQIFSAFDPTTRKAFQTWMQQGAVALTNRGEQFNAAFADLYPFATNVDSVLAVLRREGAATTTLLHQGGVVFSALSQSPSQLQAFNRNSNALFAATASRDAELAAAFRAFPAFLNESRATISTTAQFAQTTKPLIDELKPAALKLNPTLKSLEVFAPELRTLLVRIGPLTSASKQGFPALDRFLNESIPFLVRAKPYLGGIVPVLQYINDYRREISGFFANSTATTEGVLGANAGTGNLHYVRVSNPINPEPLTAFPGRPDTNRTNPYLVPGGYSKLVSGLPVFGSYLCTSRALPGLAPALSASTTSVAGTVLTIAQLVKQYYYTSSPSGPACTGQTPLGKVTTGQSQSFPHLQALP